MQGNEKKRRRRSCCVKAGCMYVLLCVLFCGLIACKKEKQQEEEESTPTAGVTWEGFDKANQELVAQRAKEYGEKKAVSVGDMELAMDTAAFFIYTMEVQGNSYASFYQSQYGEDYWTMPYDEEGRITRDVFKEETMNMLIQYAVMYDCAVKKGMELTEEEQKDCVAFVEEIKAVMSAEEAERGGFTTESLQKVCGFMMLAEKYYTNMTDNLGVTREGVRETVNKADYKEYETEYLYLATTYYDEEYNICEESDEIKEERKAQMRDYYDQVKEGTSFAELTEREETLVHNTRTFLEKGDGAEEGYREAAVKLKENEVTGPVQTEYGIYLIRMLDEDCTKSYEAAVEAEYELQRSDAFAAAYEVLLSDYEVNVNDAVWDEVVFGATVSILE